MSVARRIIKNTASLLAGNIMSGALNFFTLVYLARVFGPGDFGMMNFALAVVTYLFLFAHLGLPLFGTREVARDRRNLKEYLANILSLRVFLASASFLALTASAFYFGKNPELRALIILYGIAVIPAAVNIEWVFQGLQEMEYIGLSQIVQSVLFFLLTFLFVHDKSQLLLIPCWQLVGSLAGCAVLLVIFVRKFGPFRLRVDLPAWKSLIKGALPIGISLILAQVFYNIDTVMLGFMRTNSEVGYYNAAYKVIMLLIMLIGTYHDAIFPLIFSYFTSSQDSLKRLLMVSQRLMAIIGVPILFGGILLSGPLLRLLYGSAYDRSVGPFRILLFSVLIICFNTVYSRGVLACRKEKWFLAGVAVPAALNFFLNLFMIPLYGMNGAAITTVLAEASGFVIMYIGFSKILPVPFARFLVKPLIAAAGMSFFFYGALRFFPGHVLLIAAAGCLVYVAVLFAVRGIELNDIREIRNLLAQKDAAPQGGI